MKKKSPPSAIRFLVWFLCTPASWLPDKPCSFITFGPVASESLLVASCHRPGPTTRRWASGSNLVRVGGEETSAIPGLRMAVASCLISFAYHCASGLTYKSLPFDSSLRFSSSLLAQDFAKRMSSVAYAVPQQGAQHQEYLCKTGYSYHILSLLQAASLNYFHLHEALRSLSFEQRQKNIL